MASSVTRDYEIERVRTKDERAENANFIIYHCVVRKDHDTTNVRIVFDGSAKS